MPLLMKSNSLVKSCFLCLHKDSLSIRSLLLTPKYQIPKKLFILILKTISSKLSVLTLLFLIFAEPQNPPKKKQLYIKSVKIVDFSKPDFIAIIRLWYWRILIWMLFKWIPSITISQKVLSSRHSNLLSMAFCLHSSTIKRMLRVCWMVLFCWTLLSAQNCSTTKFRYFLQTEALNLLLLKPWKPEKTAQKEWVSFIVILTSHARKAVWKTIILSYAMPMWYRATQPWISGSEWIECYPITC